MAQEYAIGDRVRVLRNYADETLFDGEVIEVHPSGAVDVAFKKDGGVGRGLTKADHILELRGEDGKKKEKSKAIGRKLEKK